MLNDIKAAPNPIPASRNSYLSENGKAGVGASDAKTAEQTKDLVELSLGSETVKKFFIPRIRDRYDLLHETMETVHIGAEIGEAIKATGVMASLGIAGTATAGVFFGIEGVKDLKKAVREKDKVGMVEASGHLGLAAEAALETAHWATSMGAIASAVGPTVTAALHSPVAAVLGTSFGVFHGVAEAVIGGKEIYDGVKAKDKKKILAGALNFGIGLAVAGIALGGGAPLGLALGAVFLTKIILKQRKAIRAMGKVL